MQREKLAGRYKTKTAMYEALMFLADMVFRINSFQMIRSKYLFDCVVFFDTNRNFTQTIAGWVVLQERTWHRLVMEYPILSLLEL